MEQVREVLALNADEESDVPLLLRAEIVAAGSLQCEGDLVDLLKLESTMAGEKDEAVIQLYDNVRRGPDKFTLAAINGRAKVLVDVPLPKTFFKEKMDPGICVPGAVRNLHVAFGKSWTPPHFETGCAFGLAQLLPRSRKAICDSTQKEWFFWPPGEKPTKETLPSFTVTQCVGSTMYIPGGWWHAVQTTTPSGAVLYGESWIPSKQRWRQRAQVLRNMKQYLDEEEYYYYYYDYCYCYFCSYCNPLLFLQFV